MATTWHRQATAQPANAFPFCSLTLPGVASGAPAALARSRRDDVWDDAGNGIFEHVVGAEDFEVAVAAYFAACQRWPEAKISLRQGARVVHKNWRE